MKSGGSVALGCGMLALIFCVGVSLGTLWHHIAPHQFFPRPPATGPDTPEVNAHNRRVFRSMQETFLRRGDPIDRIDMGDGRIRWVYGEDEYVEFWMEEED